MPSIKSIGCESEQKLKPMKRKKKLKGIHPAAVLRCLSAVQKCGDCQMCNIDLLALSVCRDFVTFSIFSKCLFFVRRLFRPSLIAVVSSHQFIIIAQWIRVAFQLCIFLFFSSHLLVPHSHFQCEHFVANRVISALDQMKRRNFHNHREQQ